MRNDFIHRVEKTSYQNQHDSYYCCIGNEDFIDKENNPRVTDETDSRVLAKAKTKDSGRPKFLIRLDANKKFINPLAEAELKSKSKSTDLFVSQTSFKEVSNKVFDLYLSFLRTKNQTWILQAEREDF